MMKNGLSIWDLYTLDQETVRTGKPWDALLLTEDYLQIMLNSSDDKMVKHALTHPKLTVDMVQSKLSKSRSHNEDLLYHVASRLRFYPQNDKLLCFLANHTSYTDLWSVLTSTFSQGEFDEHQRDIVWRYAETAQRKRLIHVNDILLQQWMLFEAYVEFAHSDVNFKRLFWSDEKEFKDSFLSYFETTLGDMENFAILPEEWLRETLRPFRRSIEGLCYR